MKNGAVILLSSGLDSVVSLYAASKTVDIKLALTFDYGQRAAFDEINAAKKIAQKFNIEHKVINLSYLKEETACALSDNSKTLEFEHLGEESAKAVWVPNRNGLFINIAAVFADSRGLSGLIIGANSEEAQTFPDNSQNFIEAANKFFEFSTMGDVKVLAPLAKLTKIEIVNLGLDLGADFSLIKSCYDSMATTGKNHCGVCESCKRLKNAILKSKNPELADLIFNRLS